MANNGAEAVVVFTRNRDQIKVILIDMMPVMDGQESIRAIRRVNPEVKIIGSTGLIEKDKLVKVADTNLNAFLTKPYTMENLLKTIREVLSAK